MNFFAAQEKAKQNTKFLVFAFFLGVIFIILCVNLFALMIFAIFIDNSHVKEFSYYISLNFFLPITIATLLIILIGTLYQFFNLRKGGKSVAISLGGRLITKEIASLKETILLNIVEEMSLASNIPIPSVYILEDMSINAFAAGFSTDDVVIGVTKGAIQKLQRQELQGVIAHEFSHIFNTDMSLNIKTSAWIHGILVLGLIGTWILKSMSYSRKRDNAFPLIVGVGLIIIGYAGTFIGNIIKAKISRQREYLADATAVKYTRDTSGIANALKKIGLLGSSIKSSEAEIFSHFYFANGVKNFIFDSLLATHPPIKDRILRIEPDWNGEFKDSQKKKKDEEKKETNNKKKDKLYKSVAIATVFSELKKSGIIEDKDIVKAQNSIKNIPKPLLEMAKNPFSSQALILALLSSCKDEVPQSKLDEFEKSNPKLSREINIAFNHITNLHENDYLNILLLCTASLKNISIYQYQNFRDILLDWIWANQKVVLFEWILKRVIILPLDLHFGFLLPKKEKYRKFSSIKEQMRYVVSFLSILESKEPKELFEKTLLNVELFGYDFMPLEELNYDTLGKNLDTLALSSAPIRKKIVQMATLCLAKNGKLSSLNKQTLQAIAISLKVPMPPLTQDS